MPVPGSDALAREARRELCENILPFWRRHSVDHQRGGFIAELSNDLQPKASAGKGLILNARILWTFSAAWRLTKSPEDAKLAERALRYLETYFRDASSGGYFWELDPEGAPVNKLKKIYGQAFCIYALTEYHRSFDDPAALTAAVDTFRLLEQHTRDAIHGGYWETLTQSWKPCEDVRLSEKDLNEKKSMNNHLHLLEAYTNLFRVWRDPLLEQRLQELIDIFDAHILNPAKSHFRHFFDDAWNVRSDTYTYGHDIEGSWLLVEAAEVLGGKDTLDRTRQTAVSIARAVLQEGLDADGGLFYEGRDGTVILTDKEWWPQAEGVVGFLNAWQLTGDAGFFQAARKCWGFIREKIVDPVHGEWFWAVSRKGVPDHSLPKVSMWKCPYHNSRACLEMVHRLESSPVTNL